MRASIAVCLGLIACHALPAPTKAPTIDRAALAERVRQEARAAWQVYAKTAWGHDQVQPVSHAARDWYAAPLLISPVDALDTLILLGLAPEATAARTLIDDTLTFDH